MNEKNIVNEKQTAIPLYAWYALGLLTLMYMLNFVDRVLIYMLFAPIKKDLHFTDLELALLGATSFVIFYTLLGIPFGRLADRASRKKLIAFGLTIWSIFSGLTGFATGFWSIFACRMLVGIGEATLGPAALSLLSDYFPARMRATVQAIFSAAIAVGTGVAFFFGGWISDALSWRYAFYFLGFPGLLFVVLVLMLKEPERGSRDSAQDHQKKNWKLLFQNIPLRYIVFGYAFYAVSANSISIWVPTFLVRTQNLPVSQIGMFIGIGTLIGGIPGTVLGGWIADKFKAKKAGGRLLFTSITALLCIPFWLILLSTSLLYLQVACITVLLALTLAWLGPAAADVNDIAGPYLRGLAVGFYFFTVNAIGYGIAPPIFGKMNDVLHVAQNAEMMKTTLLLAPFAALLASVILYVGSKKLESAK